MKTNTIYNMKFQDLDIPDESIDLVTTDPPYNLAYSGRGEVNEFEVFDNDSITGLKYRYFAGETIDYLYHKMKQNAHIYLCIDWRNFGIWLSEMRRHFKIPNVIIWDKMSIGMGLFSFRPQHEFIIFGFKGEGSANFAKDISAVSDVWKVPRDSNYIHPTQKPVELFRRMLSYSSKENDVVFDPFMGSGTTAVACKESNRQFVGCEIDENHYKNILKRLNNVNTLSGWIK